MQESEIFNIGINLDSKRITIGGEDDDDVIAIV